MPRPHQLLSLALVALVALTGGAAWARGGGGGHGSGGGHSSGHSSGGGHSSGHSSAGGHSNGHASGGHLGGLGPSGGAKASQGGRAGSPAPVGARTSPGQRGASPGRASGPVLPPPHPARGIPPCPTPGQTSGRPATTGSSCQKDRGQGVAATSRTKARKEKGPVSANPRPTQRVLLRG